LFRPLGKLIKLATGRYMHALMKSSRKLYKVYFHTTYKVHLFAVCLVNMTIRRN